MSGSEGVKSLVQTARTDSGIVCFACHICLIVGAGVDTAINCLKKTLNYSKMMCPVRVFLSFFFSHSELESECQENKTWHSFNYQFLVLSIFSMCLERLSVHCRGSAQLCRTDSSFLSFTSCVTRKHKLLSLKVLPHRDQCSNAIKDVPVPQFQPEALFLLTCPQRRDGRPQSFSSKVVKSTQLFVDGTWFCWLSGCGMFPKLV